MLVFTFSHDYQQLVALKIRPNVPKTFLSRNWKAKATLRIIKVPHVAFTWINLVEGLLAILAEWPCLAEHGGDQNLVAW